MATRVKNLGREAQQVGIILEDGRRASIRIMPRGKGVNPPPGAKVDPRWLAEHVDARIQITEEKPAVTAPAVITSTPKAVEDAVPETAPETTAPTVTNSDKKEGE